MADSLDLDKIEARLKAATDAYYDQIAPRCSYRSAGDGAVCGLMSGHDGPHTMLMPPPEGWGFVADMSKDLRALVTEVRRLQGESAHTLTHDQAVQACANVGVDLTCGACAAVFYTGIGSPLDTHTCAERDAWASFRAEADTLRESINAAHRETGDLREAVTEAIGLPWRPIPQPFGATAYVCPDDRDILAALRAVVKERDEARAALAGEGAEADALAHALVPAVDQLREARAALAEAEATIANERGEGTPPSEGWTWIDGAWRILDDFGGNSVSARAHDTGRWHWTQHDPPYARSKRPLHSARAAMKAADEALRVRE